MTRKNHRFSFFLDFRSSFGLAQIPLIIGLLIMAIAIPVATQLSQRSQDIRNRAAYYGPSPTQVPLCTLPADCPYTENDQTAINRYCTVGLGMAACPAGKVWAPINCHSAPNATGACGAWSAFKGSDGKCKDPFCTGCTCVTLGAPTSVPPTQPPVAGCQAITSAVAVARVGSQITLDLSSSQALVCVKLEGASGVSGLTLQQPITRGTDGKYHWIWKGTATLVGSYSAQFKGNNSDSGVGNCDARAIGTWCTQVVNYRVDPAPTPTPPTFSCSGLTLNGQSGNITVNVGTTVRLASTVSHYGLISSAKVTAVGGRVVDGTSIVRYTGGTGNLSGTFNATTAGVYAVETNAYDASACNYLCSAGKILYKNTVGANRCTTAQSDWQDIGSCTSNGCIRYITVVAAPTSSVKKACGAVCTLGSQCQSGYCHITTGGGGVVQGDMTNSDDLLAAIAPQPPVDDGAARSGVCRNRSCPTDTDCVCPVSRPTNTPTRVPTLVPTNPPAPGCQAITSTVIGNRVGNKMTFDVSSPQALVCVKLTGVSGVTNLSAVAVTQEIGKWHWKWVANATTEGTYVAQFSGNTVDSGVGSCDARAIGTWCNQVVNYRIDPAPTPTPPTFSCSGLTLNGQSANITVNVGTTVRLASTVSHYGLISSAKVSAIGGRVVDGTSIVRYTGGTKNLSGIFNATAAGIYAVETNAYDASSCNYLCSAGKILYKNTVGANRCVEAQSDWQDIGSCTSNGCIRYITVVAPVGAKCDSACGGACGVRKADGTCYGSDWGNGVYKLGCCYQGCDGPACVWKTPCLTPECKFSCTSACLPTNTPVRPSNTPVPGCKECPTTFSCYKLEKDSQVEYRWFVPGYIMSGFVKTADSGCVTANVLKPTFKGKVKGDANCDGKIDVADYAVWRREFVDLSLGLPKVSKDWEADFTGSNGKCDGIVNVFDYSLWQKYFSELMISGGN